MPGKALARKRRWLGLRLWIIVRIQALRRCVLQINHKGETLLWEMNDSKITKQLLFGKPQQDSHKPREIRHSRNAYWSSGEANWCHISRGTAILLLGMCHKEIIQNNKITPISIRITLRCLSYYILKQISKEIMNESTHFLKFYKFHSPKITF